MNSLVRVLLSGLFLGLFGLILFNAYPVAGYIWWGLSCLYCWAIVEKVSDGR